LNHWLLFVPGLRKLAENTRGTDIPITNHPPTLSVDSPAGWGQASGMKRATLLTILLLAPALAFGQKFQDVTAKGAPVSLLVKADYPDMGPYVAVHNNSSKGILALVAVVRTTDEHGQVVPCFTRQDYAFKLGVIAPKEERGVGPLAPEPRVKIDDAVGAVFFAQFDDGSIWGDPEAGMEMLAARPQKLTFLKHLVETYYESGDAAFAAALNEPKPRSPEYAVAACLKGDADYDKISTIDLAKKRLADAQEWRAFGIF